MVLRRPRLGAVRRDHPAAGVLPDPPRARDPRARAPRDRARSRAPTRSSSSARARRRRPGCCSTRCATRARSRASCRSTSASRRCTTRRPRSSRSTPASTCSRSSATSRSTSTRSRAAAAGSSRSSAARSATCCPTRAPRSSRDVAAMLGPDDHFLLGTDLVKDVARLEAAYDDARGVTAEFNKNVLHVMNRELDADFDVDAFEHVAVFDPERGVDRDAAALDARADRARRARSISRCRSPRARRCAPRSAPSSAATARARAARRRAWSSSSGGPTPTATSRSRSPAARRSGATAIVGQRADPTRSSRSFGHLEHASRPRPSPRRRGDRP